MSYLKPLAKVLVPKKYRPPIEESLKRYRRAIGRMCRSLLYIGNQVICPCCGGHFRKFLPVLGVNQRLNAQCPRCGSLERHRLLWLYLKNRTNLFSDNLELLHFAPEYIFQKKLRSMPSLDYISVDLVSHSAMAKMDITNILYEENSFDVILCSHVLEHVIDDQKAMKELFRVLKPGGWAIILSAVAPERDKTLEDPNIILPEDRTRIFGHKDHKRIYGRDYKDKLEKAGFTVKVDDYLGELEADIIKQYGLKIQMSPAPDENIHFCTKPGSIPAGVRRNQRECLQC